MLRKSFGLDDLDVTTSDEGGAALKAGKYISENVYTEIEVDQDGKSQINLNLDLRAPGSPTALYVPKHQYVLEHGLDHARHDAAVAHHVHKLDDDDIDQSRRAVLAGNLEQAESARTRWWRRGGRGW